MPAKSTTKGPNALAPNVPPAGKMTAIPAVDGANAPVAPLSAAFRAALGPAPASDHLHLPGAAAASRPSRVDRNDKVPKPSAIRNIAQGPRSGHK